MQRERIAPWAGIGATAGMHPPPLQEGVSPCQGCQAPCCWVAQLFQTVPETLTDLDFLKYAAGFERIELGINSGGTWIVNYRAPCRHLLPSLRCELHGTPQKPIVCQQYDEHKCMYRTAFVGPMGAGYLRLDLQRFRALERLIRFDDAGNVAEVPSREEILEAVAAADSAREEPARPVVSSPVKRLAEGVRWNAAAARPTGTLRPPEEVLRTWDEAVRSPCDRCPAPCCQVLVFDFGTPANVRSIDYMEYLLGFPGIELALTPLGWKTMVRSTCRHFDRESMLCGVWGQPERPLICSRYDEHKCAYRSWLMEPQRVPFVRVDHDTFQAVQRHFPLDEDGQVTASLSVEQLVAILAVVAPGRPRVVEELALAGAP